MDISEAAKLALAVGGGASVITFWVNSIATSIDGLAKSANERAEAYDRRTRMLGEQFRVQLERENRPARVGASHPPVLNDSGLDPEAQRIINAVGRRTQGPGR